MNWKEEAIRDLKSYPRRKEAIENIKKKIQILEERFVSLRGISTGNPVKGGISKQEENRINNIAERERLGFSLKISEQLVALTEKGLNGLDERERRVLEGFYINPIRVEALCEAMHIEKSRLYQIRDSALRNYTLTMYGTVEI